MPARPATLRLVLGLVLLGLVLGGGAWSCRVWTASMAQTGLPRVTLRRTTPAERQETLVRLRAAWNLRPDAVNADADKEEVRFINRVGAFGRAVRGTEAFDPACRLYADCLRDHLRRYGR